MAATDSYRITADSKIDSSSEEGEIVSDDEIEVEGTKQLSAMDTVQPSVKISNDQNARRRPKNIWSQVLADQSSNDISSSLGTVGMKNFMSRGPESFSVEPTRRYYRDDESSSSDGEAPAKMMKTETIEEEMENYMIERHFRNQSRKTETCPASKVAKLKRKKAKKAKPGSCPGYKPGQRVVLNKKLEITKQDSEERVAEEISYRLWEKKKDLIKALVRCIGVERSLFLYNKTEILELNGGLMTLQQIFEADYQRDREQWRAVKEAKKNKKVDIGVTPHNSPQMEPVGSPSSSPRMETTEPKNGESHEANEMET